MRFDRLKVWQVLLLFPFLLYWAYSSYVDFTRLEEEGGVIYVGRTTKLMYNLGGKWAVVALPLLIAGVWAYAVYKTFALSRRAEELEAQAAAPPETARVPAPPAPASKPPASRPPAPRPPSASGPITPLAAAPPPPPARADDEPLDASGPRFLR